MLPQFLAHFLSLAQVYELDFASSLEFHEVFLNLYNQYPIIRNYFAFLLLIT